MHSTLAPGERLILQVRAHPVAYLWPLSIFLLSLWPGPMVRMFRTEICLTDRHLIIHRGGRRYRWEHDKIDLIRVSQGPLARLLDFGKLTLWHRDGAQFRLPGIVSALLLQQQTEAASELAILGRPLIAALPKEAVIAEEMMRF